MPKKNLHDQATIREIILNRIRNATTGRQFSEIVRPSGSFVHESQMPLYKTFAESLEKVSGTTTLCDTISETLAAFMQLAKQKGWETISCPDKSIVQHLKSLYDVDYSNEVNFSTDVVITGCEALIADTGSIMVSSAHTGSRKAFVLAPAHVVVASQSQLTKTADEALEQIIKRYKGTLPSMISILTGPSRTADIEKTLILGAHGPKELYVFITRQII